MCISVASNEYISAFYFQFESQEILICLQSNKALTHFIPQPCE